MEVSSSECCLELLESPAVGRGRVRKGKVARQCQANHKPKGSQQDKEQRRGKACQGQTKKEAQCQSIQDPRFHSSVCVRENENHNEVSKFEETREK